MSDRAVYIIYIMIFILGTFVSSISQVILKKSAGKTYESKIREYLNIRVMGAYTVFFLATLCVIIAYKKVPLSMGAILESSGYFFVAVLSYIFLKEHISKQKILGLAIIIAGIVIYAL